MESTRMYNTLHMYIQALEMMGWFFMVGQELVSPCLRHNEIQFLPHHETNQPIIFESLQQHVEGNNSHDSHWTSFAFMLPHSMSCILKTSM